MSLHGIDPKVFVAGFCLWVATIGFGIWWERRR